MGLASALNWYQKKIGTYDKQLWEKTVEQRILQGVSAIPKKTARIKTELIDVDLVRGSAFPKAKPQHSWIAATSAGVIRVLFLPFYFNWWQQQTSTCVSSILVTLYFLQGSAMYLYFSSEESDFPDVPTSEIVTPVVMMLVLGIVHSQIVATFTNKTSHKKMARTKRKRVKRKTRSKSASALYESKSSPETASEERLDHIHHLYQPEKNTEKVINSHLYSFNKDDEGKIHNENAINKSLISDSSSLENQLYDEKSNLHPSHYKEALNISCLNEAERKKKDSDDESGLDSLDLAQQLEEVLLEKKLTQDIPTCHIHGRNLLAENNNKITDNSKTFISENCKLCLFCEENLKCNNNTLSKTVLDGSTFNQKSQVLRSDSVDTGNVSSGEEYFVAKNPSNFQKRNIGNFSCAFSQESLNSHDNCAECRGLNQKCNLRRFSDIGERNSRTISKHQIFKIEQSGRRFSEDGLLTQPKQFNCSASQLGSPFANMHRSGRTFCGCRGSHNCSNIRGTYVQNKRGPRRVPASLCLSDRGCYSSCESEADTTSPNTPTKPQTSDLDWPIITNTDCISDSSDYTSQSSHEETNDISLTEDPFAWEMQETPSSLFPGGYTGSDKVSCTVWEHNECKKVDLTVLDISSAIIRKVDSNLQSTEYLAIGSIFAAIISFLPLLFRLQNGTARDAIQDVTSDVFLLTVPSTDEVARVTEVLQEVMLGSTLRARLSVLIVVLERFMLSAAYFFLLSVAEKTFKLRFLYAKHFCHLTSSRRARRSDLPHFRLNKVRNIKTWLSVRSYLKKHGPQRSVDVIVSTAFIIEVCVLSFLCVQLLKETEQFAERLYCWETVCWNLALGIFLLRFMILGSKINKKYRNLSVLITEQINLYLHMEQKPHKKEELMLANNVLKLAADLLKELESPFKISGLCANPYLYNITKVVVLSAFSAVLTELLGFKLKLHKIKIK